MDNEHTLIEGILWCQNGQSLGPILYQLCIGNGMEAALQWVPSHGMVVLWSI